MARTPTCYEEDIKAELYIIEGDINMDKTITRDEMIGYIRSHPFEKITHHLFDPSEYIYSKEDGKVYDENDYLFEDWFSNLFTGHSGIRLRFGGQWDYGWRIISNTNK